jgi:hypothetical protein
MFLIHVKTVLGGVLNIAPLFTPQSSVLQMISYNNVTFIKLVPHIFLGTCRFQMTMVRQLTYYWIKRPGLLFLTDKYCFYVIICHASWSNFLEHHDPLPPAASNPLHHTNLKQIRCFVRLLHITRNPLMDFINLNFYYLHIVPFLWLPGKLFLIGSNLN